MGAFRDAIQELRRKEMVSPIQDHLAAGKPFLGICLGLQLLFDVSYEDGEWPGLGIVAGSVVKFRDQPGLKIPHMGWNSLTLTNGWLDDRVNGQYVYFVHSYYVPVNPHTTAITDYILPFSSAIKKDNFYAVQFHPEKSSAMGEIVLRSFLNKS